MRQPVTSEQDRSLPGRGTGLHRTGPWVCLEAGSGRGGDLVEKKQQPACPGTQSRGEWQELDLWWTWRRAAQTPREGGLVAPDGNPSGYNSAAESRLPPEHTSHDQSGVCRGPAVLTQCRKTVRGISAPEVP